MPPPQQETSAAAAPEPDGAGPDGARQDGARQDGAGPEPARCSAKGCGAEAVWALRWNNPRLHTPERRKLWAACEEHREHLAGFLTARGFLRDVVPLAEAEPDPGPPPPAGGARP